MSDKDRSLGFSVGYFFLSAATLLLYLWWCQVTLWAFEGNYPMNGFFTLFFLICSLFSYVVYSKQFQVHFTKYLDLRADEREDQK